MRKRAFGAVALGLAMATIAAARFGGWAVVHVKDAPDYFVVDNPATFDFVVRQHGVTPLDGLTPSVSARKGVRWVNGTVTPRPEPGVYRATITIPSSGDWAVSIGSGFGASRGRMLAKPAIAAGETPPAISPAEKGRQLFASA